MRPEAIQHDQVSIKTGQVWPDAHEVLLFPRVHLLIPNQVYSIQADALKGAPVLVRVKRHTRNIVRFKIQAPEGLKIFRENLVLPYMVSEEGGDTT